VPVWEALRDKIRINPLIHVQNLELTWQKQRLGQGGLEKSNYPPIALQLNNVAIQYKMPLSKGP